MGRHKAKKVVRKEGRSPLIFQFHCAAPTVPPLCKRLELAFFRGGGGGGGGGGVSYSISV